MKQRTVHIIMIFIFLGFLSAGIWKCNAQDTVQAVIIFDCVPTYEQEPLVAGDTICAYFSHPDSMAENSGIVEYNGFDSVFALSLNGPLDIEIDSQYQELNFRVYRNSSSCYTSYVTHFFIDEQRNTPDSLFITAFNVSVYNVIYPKDTVCKYETTLEPYMEKEVPDLYYLVDSGLYIDGNGIIYPSMSTTGTKTIRFETEYCMLKDSVQIDILGGMELGLTDSLMACDGLIDLGPSDNLLYVNTDNPGEYLDVSIEGIHESSYYRAIDQNGCLSGDSVYIEYLQPPDFNIRETEECNSVIVNVESFDRTLSSVVWSDTNTNTVDSNNQIEVFENRIIQVEVTDEYGCTKKQDVDVEVKPFKLETVDYSKEESECWYDGKLEIQSAVVDNSRGNSRFELRNTLTNQIVTNLNSIPEGIYELEAVDDRNCRSALIQPITIYQKCLEDYPVITPNNDGDEDEYFIPYNGTIQIFDRNGKMVNEVEAPVYWNGRSFDGRILPMGNYVMVADNGRAVNITLVK